MPKGLFIGLGGTGVATLTKLKARLFHDAYGQSMNVMDNECKFIFYDTDPRSKTQALADAEIGRLMGQDHFVIEEDEYITAATVKPYSRYKGAKTAAAADLESQRMLEWMIDPDVPGHIKLEDKELGQGAGANRMKGRVGIMCKFGEFEKKINSALNGLSGLENQGANQEVQRPHIWVFASSNGGTSSSALLDVLYLINRVYREKYQSDPYLRLVLYMPKPFITVNKNSVVGYTLNGYATLWELNAFRYDRLNGSEGGKKFGTFAVRPDLKTTWRDNPWSVCSYVMAIDLESKAGKLNSIEQMIDNTANICYFLHSGSVGDSMVSKLDNDYDEDKAFFKEFKKPQNEKFGWAYFVVGSGYKTLTKADEYLKEYVRKRFRYDLFGSGLLGLPFDKILPKKDDQINAAKKFANDYVLKHLINIDNYDSSIRESLYCQYKIEFDKIQYAISENETPTRDDWDSSGETFIENCSELKTRLEAEFNSSRKGYFMDAIMESVCEGVDKCVVDYGLNYTYSLLNIVDDQFLETEVQDKLSRTPDLKELGDTIGNCNTKSRRSATDRAALINAMGDYRSACIQKVALDHVCKIIAEITQSEIGFLEYLRKGDEDHIGIIGLQKAFGLTFVDCKTEYDRLAVTFKDTKKEPCTEYFPRVREMVDEKSSWIRKNKFEELYGSIMSLDTSENALAFEDKNHGCPPKRDGAVSGGLAHSIVMVKKDDAHRHLFADMALGNEVAFMELRERLENHINDYVNVLLSNPSKVLTWLNYKLEEVFDAQFTKKDGSKDHEARRQYISEFNANIPVFYPTRADRTSEVMEHARYLYVGATEDFAKKMGFDPAREEEMQYLADNSLKNQLLVCKLEVGHNFYDYMYFDDLKDMYESNVETIMKGGSGCHIHKGFLTRDIAKAYERRKAKKFEDFIKLCWFDSYFELLNKNPRTMEITESIFGVGAESMIGIEDLNSTQKKNKSKKSLEDDIDLLEDEDLLGGGLDDESDGLVFDDAEHDDDLSLELPDYDEDMEIDKEPIEEGLSAGYRPIVTIESDLTVSIKALKKSEMAGILAFSVDGCVEEDVSGSNLVQIRKSIINKLGDVDYAKIYFANFSEMFASLDEAGKKQLVIIHKANKDKVKDAFIKKIKPILQRRKKHDAKDNEVVELLNRCVLKLMGRDIFK